MNLVARGYDVKTIVYDLGLTAGSRTVETHLNRAMRKLGVADRNQLARLVLPMLALSRTRESRDP